MTASVIRESDLFINKLHGLNQIFEFSAKVPPRLADILGVMVQSLRGQGAKSGRPGPQKSKDANKKIHGGKKVCGLTPALWR